MSELTNILDSYGLDKQFSTINSNTSLSDCISAELKDLMENMLLKVWNEVDLKEGAVEFHDALKKEVQAL